MENIFQPLSHILRDHEIVTHLSPDVSFLHECLDTMLEILASSLTELDLYSTNIPVEEVERVSLMLTIVKHGALSQQNIEKYADVVGDLGKLLESHYTQNPVFMFNDLEDIQWDEPISFEDCTYTPRELLKVLDAQLETLIRPQIVAC